MEENKTDSCGCEGRKKSGMDGKCMMPEVTFSAFVMSLNTSVLFHMGELADPATGRKTMDLDLARHGIDTLVMIQQKTKGNLSHDEEDLLKNLLYDLQMRFVQVKKK